MRQSATNFANDRPIKRDWIIIVVLVIIGSVLPYFIGSRYTISQLTLFMIWATVVSQWNIVMGFAGIFSLAQLVLFAIGGYTVAITGNYYGVHPFIGMLLGGCVSVVAGVLIGLACLRLRGIYVALLTFAIAQAVFLLVSTDISCFSGVGETCQSLTGGPRGLSDFGDFGFRKILGRNYIVGNYYVALAALILATLVSTVIVRGPLGFAFRALRDNEAVAICAGINRFKYQLLVFAVSAFVTGIAGGVYAAHFKVIGPSVLGFPLMSFLVSMMVVGGLGKLWGPIIGAALLMLADEQLRDFTEYRNMGLGALIILFIVVLPDGVVGMAERLWKNLKVRPS
jgi:branched-chain amino acid transport system permease protein